MLCFHRWDYQVCTVDINQKKHYLPLQPPFLIQDGFIDIHSRAFPRQNTHISYANKLRGRRLLLFKLPLTSNNHHHTPHPQSKHPHRLTMVDPYLL